MVAVAHQQLTRHPAELTLLIRRISLNPANLIDLFGNVGLLMLDAVSIGLSVLATLNLV